MKGVYVIGGLILIAGGYFNVLNNIFWNALLFGIGLVFFVGGFFAKKYW